MMNHFWTTRLGAHEWLMKRAMLPWRVARGWGEVRDGRGLGSPRAILTPTLTLTLTLTLTSLARGVDDLVLVEGHEVHMVEAAQLLLTLLPAGRVDDLAHVLDDKVALVGLGSGVRVRVRVGVRARG